MDNFPPFLTFLLWVFSAGSSSHILVSLFNSMRCAEDPTPTSAPNHPPALFGHVLVFSGVLLSFWFLTGGYTCTWRRRLAIYSRPYVGVPRGWRRAFVTCRVMLSSNVGAMLSDHEDAGNHLYCIHEDADRFLPRGRGQPIASGISLSWNTGSSTAHSGTLDDH